MKLLRGALTSESLETEGVPRPARIDATHGVIAHADRVLAATSSHAIVIMRKLGYRLQSTAVIRGGKGKRYKRLSNAPCPNLLGFKELLGAGAAQQRKLR